MTKVQKLGPSSGSSEKLLQESQTQKTASFTSTTSQKQKELSSSRKSSAASLEIDPSLSNTAKKGLSKKKKGFEVTEETEAKNEKSSTMPTWLSLRIAPPVIVYSIVGGYLIGYLQWSILWLLVLLYILSSFVFGEIKRLQKVLRHEAYKENAQFLLANQSETVEWLNHILERFWIVYSPDLSKDIARSVELVLETAKPGFLESLTLPIFTLGTTGPCFSNAHVYPSLEPDLIHLDLDLSFEPKMAEDNQTDGARIQLVAKMVKIDLPVSVNDIHFRGKLRLQLKLISRHPYIQLLEFCFLQPPQLDFVLKPLIPVNVMDVPLFQDFLYNLVQSALSGFVSPSTFVIDIEKMMNPDKTANVSLGVAFVTVKQAKDLPNMESISTIFNQGNVSDPFARIMLDNGVEVGRTKVIDDTLSPIWNESFYVLVPPQTEFLTFQIFHESTIGKQFIGQHREKIPIGDKVEGWYDLSNKTNEKKVKGQIRFEIEYFNRIDQSVLEVLESAVKSSHVDVSKDKPILNMGIMHFNILEGKDLSMFPGVCPQVIGILNGEKKFHTGIKKNTTKPAWNEFQEMFIEDFENDDIELTVVDSRTSLTLASIIFPATEVKDLGPSSSEWHELAATGIDGSAALKGFKTTTPRLRFNASFYPVDIRSHPKTKIPKYPGILEIKLVDASNLLAVNLDGKSSDPFVTIEINNKTIYQTNEYAKNLNPIFKDESTIGILLDTTDLHTLMFNIMDYNNIGKHKPMGSVFFDLMSIIKLSDDKEEVLSLYEKEYLDVKGDVKLKGKAAGSLRFKIRFRMITKEKETSLRRRKDGNHVEADDALGIDAPAIIILSEDSGITASKSFLMAATSKIMPSTIFSQVTGKSSKNVPIKDGSPTGTLEITLIKAENLLAVNRGEESSDPYVNIELNGGLIYKSQTYMNELNPDFSKEDMVLHPISLQSIIQMEKVTFRVKDYNKILTNKLIGEAQLNVANLLEFEKDSNINSPGCKFKSPDGIQCILTNIKTFEGALTLINDEKFAGKLFVRVTMHFKNFTTGIESSSITAENKKETDLLSVKPSAGIDLSIKAEFTLIEEKLYTIPDFQKNEKCRSVMKIKSKSGDLVYCSKPLREKAHFSKLMPLQSEFFVFDLVDTSKTSLLISFEDSEQDKSIQIFSIAFEVKTGVYAFETYLTDWLKIVMDIEGKVSTHSRSGSVSMDGSESSTVKQKRRFFGFMKNKK